MPGLHQAFQQTGVIAKNRRVGLWFEVISPAAPRQTVRAVFPHTAFRLSSSCRITASQGVRTD